MTLLAITLMGTFFFGMGVFALARPSDLIRPFGINLPAPESRAEIRAVYGGFGLAMAAVLGLAAGDAALRDGILITVAAALGGMAFGRLISGVVDRPKAFYPNWFYLVVELAGATALIWAVQG